MRVDYCLWKGVNEYILAPHNFGSPPSSCCCPIPLWTQVRQDVGIAECIWRQLCRIVPPFGFVSTTRRSTHVTARPSCWTSPFWLASRHIVSRRSFFDVVIWICSCQNKVHVELVFLDVVNCVVLFVLFFCFFVFWRGYITLHVRNRLSFLKSSRFAFSTSQYT